MSRAAIPAFVKPFAALAVTLSIAAAPAARAQPREPRLSGYVTLTTDYRNRGLSQTDGEPALQAGIDYQHSRGWFIGAFASNVEFAAEAGDSDRRETEIDAYLGYDWQLDDWALTATFARYSYAGAGDDAYDELTAGVRFRDRVYLTTSRTHGFGSRGLEASNHELTVIVPLRFGLELGATIGRAEIERIPSSAYSHWNVGISKLVGRASFDLRFYDDSYGITTYLGDAGPNQWVVSVTYGFLGG